MMVVGKAPEGISGSEGATAGSASPTVAVTNGSTTLTAAGTTVSVGTATEATAGTSAATTPATGTTGAVPAVPATDPSAGSGGTGGAKETRHGLTAPVDTWRRVFLSLRGMYPNDTSGLSDDAALQAVIRFWVRDSLFTWETTQAQASARAVTETYRSERDAEASEVSRRSGEDAKGIV